MLEKELISIVLHSYALYISWIWNHGNQRKMRIRCLVWKQGSRKEPGLGHRAHRCGPSGVGAHASDCCIWPPKKDKPTRTFCAVLSGQTVVKLGSRPFHQGLRTSPLKCSSCKNLVKLGSGYIDTDPGLQAFLNRISTWVHMWVQLHSAQWSETVVNQEN